MVLQSEQLRVEVAPCRGANITSLRHLDSSREWLLQDPAVDRAPPAYGSRFTEAGMSGWDEMLPTVDECTYPAEPFLGAPLPDHGEVWAVGWETERVTAEALVCSVRGRVLPYLLRRELKVRGSTLSAEYSLFVEGQQPLGLLWAAHPQFVVGPGTVVTLPPHIEELTCVVEGAPGPLTRMSAPDEGLVCTDIVGGGTGMMLYARPDDTVAQAKLTDPDGAWLQMDWETADVPYFAIWMDNGLYAGSPVVCPEPMTGYYDSLRRAYESDRLAMIEPGKPIRWALHVTLGKG